MKLKILLPLIVLIVFCNTDFAYSKDAFYIEKLLYNENDKNIWVKEYIYINKESNLIDKAYNVFFNLFKTSSNKDIYNFPENIKINKKYINDDILVLDVTEDILNYIGGSRQDIIYNDMLIKNAFNIDKKIKNIDLLINGEKTYLKNGLIVGV